MMYIIGVCLFVLGGTLSAKSKVREVDIFRIVVKL